MRVLGIDTASRLAGVALVDTTAGGWWLQAASLGQRRGETLTAVIERAMDEMGWAARGLDGIAVAVGPGSYTGLRVGLAVAKTLAWAWDVPLAGVGTLHAQALGAAWAAPVVVVALDAGHGEVFGAAFRVEAARGVQGEAAAPGRVELRALVEPQPVAVEALARALADGRGRWGVDGAAAAGDGCRRYRAALEAIAGIRWVWVPEEAELARPALVARLGAQRLTAGEADDPVTLEARYLKATEAERRWLPKS